VIGGNGDDIMDIVKGIKASPEINLVMEEIQNNYELLEYLGGGGFSHVYLIRHKLLGKKCALKIMDFRGILNDLEKAKVPDIHHELKRIKKRFINEAIHYDKFDHPNIAKIYDVGVATSQSDDIEVPYLIMQFFEGRSLEELINKAKDSFKLATIVRISKDILTALGTLHMRGIIHRDINPKNIIIEKGSNKAILIDFGLAKDIIYGTKLTIDLTTMGTPHYMSPEQFTDSSQVGPETDIYAFGVVLYQMATGTLPYSGTTICELMNKHCESPFPDIKYKDPAISSELNAIIKTSMAKKPEERYRTSKELLDELESLEKKSILRQKPSKYASPKKAPVRNKKRWIALVILATIMIIAAFLYKNQLKEILGLPRFIESKDQKEAAKNKLTEEDDQAFESASSENTIDAYEGYVEKYPTGRHKDEAKTRLKNLIENLSIVIQNDYSRPIFVVKFSPDGKYVISVDGMQNIQIWDSSNFKMIKSFSSGHGWYIWSASFSPDGKYIATGSLGRFDKMINLYELKTGTKIRTFKGHSDYILSVDFSPAGKSIISGSIDKTIKLWDVESGDEINTFRCPAVTSVKFTPDGKQILSGDGKKTLILWDIESSKKVRTFRGHSDTIWEVDISPNGKYALSGCEDKKIKLWDLSSGKEIRSFKGHFDIYTDCLKFSPDGKYVLSLIDDYNLKMWEMKTGKEIRTFTGNSEEVFSVDFSPDGNNIISGSFDGTIKLWNIESGKPIKTIQISIEGLYEVTFSSSGKFALTKTEKDTILWDIEAGKVIMTIKGNADDGNSIAFTPDERYFLYSDGKAIILREVQTGKKLQTFIGHTGSVNSLDISPDGKSFLSCSRDRSIKLWSLETGKEIRTYSGHSDDVNSVAFSPDGKLALSGSYDKTMKLWDIEKGREIRTFKEDSGVSKVFFSHDPKYVIMSGNLGKITFWNIETGKKVRTKDLHINGTESIAFSTDGNRAVSGGCDDKVKLWEVQTGNILRTFKKHQSTVYEVAFINEGKHIISGSADGSIILWDTKSGEDLAQFISFRDGEWAAVTSEGYYNCSPNGEKYLNV
jgi:WD40 repeat protein